MMGKRGIILGASLLAFSSPALAQERGARSGEKSVAMESVIIVTARRRDESVQDVPGVVNAVTSDALGKLNIRDFKDISTIVPGLDLAPNNAPVSGTGIGSISTVRGVAFDVGAAGNNGTIQFYMNDAAVDSGTLFTGMFDVGRIEVLRGPQGTLRGRSAPSGSINIIFKRPDLYEVGGNASFTVNDIHGYNFNGALNVPVIAEKLAVRIAGMVSDDQFNRVRPLARASSQVPVNRSDNETNGIRVSVSADPFEGLLKLDFMYQSIDRKNVFYDQVQSISEFAGTAAGAEFIGARDRKGVPSFAKDYKYRFKTYQWQAQLSHWDQQLTYIGHLQRNDIRTTNPFDPAAVFDNPFGPLMVSDALGRSHPTGDIAGLDQYTETAADSDSHEVRLQNEVRLFGMIDYTVGYLNYRADTPSALERYGATVALPSFTGGQPTILFVLKAPFIRYNKTNEESVFGNLNFHLGERTELSAGIRRIWYKVNSGLLNLDAGGAAAGVPVSYDFPAGLTVDNLALKQDESKRATVYIASLKHNFTDTLMAYSTYGRAWRPGRVLIGTPPNPASELWTSFLNSGDETSDSYEVGVKSEWFDQRVVFNLSGYYQKFRNYGYSANNVLTVVPSTVAGGTPSITPRNFLATVPVEVKGIEAELMARPTDRWTLGATLAFADGKIKNGLIPCVDVDGDNVPDTAVPNPAAYATAAGADNVNGCRVTQKSNNAPRWSGTVQAEYAMPLATLGDGYLRGLLSWKGDSSGNPTNPNDSVKAFGILNLYGGLRAVDGSWDISVYAKNVAKTFRVLDRTSAPLSTLIASAIPGISIPSTGNGYYGITVTEPREFGINLRVAFGSR